MNSIIQAGVGLEWYVIHWRLGHASKRAMCPRGEGVRLPSGDEMWDLKLDRLRRPVIQRCLGRLRILLLAAEDTCTTTM